MVTEEETSVDNGTAMDVDSGDADRRLPEKPLIFLSGGHSNNHKLVDLTSIEERLLSTHERRERAFTASRSLQKALGNARSALDTACAEDPVADARLHAEVCAVLAEHGDGNDAPRVANLGQKMEAYVRYRAYRHFLATGTLLPSSGLSSSAGPALHVRDEEYLGGACIGLSHDLARYAVGRAIARDVYSVRTARDLVDALMFHLLRFDFRNGPLRRKYDGVKYALKKIETILYELSVTSSNNNGTTTTTTTTTDPPHKKAKLESQLLDGTELDEIRTRMEKRDEMRENLIKRCRDAQKAAKQAIFALHRQADGALNNQEDKSTALLAKCEKIILHDLHPIVTAEPDLRSGSSFSGVLEEYVEAKLFERWLGSNTTTSEDDDDVVDQQIWTVEDFHEHFRTLTDDKKNDAVTTTPTTPPLALLPSEYLGGLCDLTGEVGRYAVKMGTVRNRDAVRRCLATNMSVLYALQNGLGTYLPVDTNRKMGALRMTVEKSEHILYELSLLEAGRSRNSDSSSVGVGESQQEGARSNNGGRQQEDGAT